MENTKNANIDLDSFLNWSEKLDQETVYELYPIFNKDILNI